MYTKTGLKPLRPVTPLNDSMSVKQFKFKREKSKLQRQQTRLWQVVDVELPYIGTKLKSEKTKLFREKTSLSKKSKLRDIINDNAGEDGGGNKESRSAPPVRDSVKPLHLPVIFPQSTYAENKRRNLPQDRVFARQLTTLKFPSNRKGADREKRVPLKGWEADWKSDDGMYC